MPNSAEPPRSPPQPTPLKLTLIADVIADVIIYISLIPSNHLVKLFGLTISTDTDRFSPVYSPTSSTSIRCQVFQEASHRRHRIASLSAFFFFIATVIFSSLRSSSFLGSPLYRWSFLAAVIFSGRSIAYGIVGTAEITLRLLPPSLLRKRRLTYYAVSLSQQVASFLHSALIFLTWKLLGFATDLYPVTFYCAWVSAAWLFRCTLGLINATVVSKWKEKVLYKRYEERILRVGFQIHILNLLNSDGSPISSLIMVPWKHKEGHEMARDFCYKVEDHIRHFTDHFLTLEELWFMACYIQALTAIWPPHLKTFLGNNGVQMFAGIDPAVHHRQHLDERWLKEKLGLSSEDAQIMYGELCAMVTSPDKVSYHTLSTWMEGAYKDNLKLGNTLREEDLSIIDGDRLLMGLLISEAFLLWMFFTGKTIAQVFAGILFVYFGLVFVAQVSAYIFRKILFQYLRNDH